ncbi:hypothetical protein [Persicitalea jodogahamensis]|uniref:Uncharacterized protein n=1 Tax=Persicitalea jodogahamensis TaxID=402147 RepID=A0A8J3D6D4_9BACT|nr:hypothetical protein [Persicitalea jodogahamensis]GHB59676.1 hypothetical protein GCM10007390_11700 [Persicitalea jodogahamensis]
MSAKQIFAILLTVLGIGGLIYTAMQLLDNNKDQFMTLTVVGILGLIFFSAGIKLLQSSRDV